MRVPDTSDSWSSSGQSVGCSSRRGSETARGRIRAAALVIVVLTVAAFLPVVNADFLNYDDPRYVTGNPHVVKGLHADGMLWALTTFHAANWHPLTWFSHMLDVSLFGLRSGPHHVTNLALHTCSAVLLLLLLNGMTGAWWPSFVAAAIFSVHPLRVESVAWISERKDVLSVLLGMLTLVSYLWYAKRPAPGRYWIVTAVFSLGLMSKPMLVTLPFVLLLLDWWPLGRLRWSDAGAAGQWTTTRRIIREKAPFLLLATASSAVTYLAQQRGGAIISTNLFPVSARIENAVVSYVRYIGKALWPRDLIPFYRHTGPSLSLLTLIFAFLLLAGLTACAFAARRRRPWLLVGWLWFVGVLVPVLGLLQVGLQGMADRYSYLPFVGLVIAIVWEIWTRTARTGRGSGALGLTSVAVLSVLAFLTWRQSAYWKDPITLFTRVVQVDPLNFPGYNMLGVQYLLRHEAAQSVSLFRRALAIRPDYLDSRFNLGLALAELGETDEAIEAFNAVLRVSPRDVECRFNLGQALLAKGRSGEALQHFESTLAVDPDEPAFLLARGIALARLGRIAEAAGDFRRVVELEPADAEARANLEHALKIIREEAR